MPTALTRATYSVSEALLEQMLLAPSELPSDLATFERGLSGSLDNLTMAEQGFPGNSEDTFVKLGRITGYLAEYRNPSPPSAVGSGTEVAAGTVVHLFENEDRVSHWMTNVFLKQFEANVGFVGRDGSKLMSVEELNAAGFSDGAVCLHATQRTATGLVSSTVLDFRVGRLLGVAFVASEGDLGRLDRTTKLALALERKIVSVTLSQ